MPTDCITFQSSGYFTPIMNDYLERKPHLNELYNRFPTLESFGEQFKEKQAQFDAKTRMVLVNELQKQYANVPTSELTNLHINLLKSNSTFTVTTGHQLNLFTGPLYFLYKIISTINLCKELKAHYPEQNFVPIYWMATEDHDFEEINYFNFKGKNIRWNNDAMGPVGRFSTAGLQDVFEVFALELGNSLHATTIKNLFEAAYLQHENLSDATRYLANALFGKYGLVILDADRSELKRQFIPFVKDELLHQTAFQKVTETIAQLKAYPIQVQPREINLFYIEDRLRARIVFENGIYKVLDTTIQFSEAEILLELEEHPEQFSPNVIMRPLYQEVILPNLCYIGGGGEIAYWLELKSYFEASKIPFPILLLRNSALLVSEKQAKKADKLGLSWADLFAKQTQLLTAQTQLVSEFPIDLTAQKQVLKAQFEALKRLAMQTDKSFLGAVNAQETKQIKGLAHLEKRLLKAQKRHYADLLSRITELQNELFPNQSLQERQANFSTYYLENGELLLSQLMAELQPLAQNFNVLVLP